MGFVDRQEVDLPRCDQSEEGSRAEALRRAVGDPGGAFPDGFPGGGGVLLGKAGREHHRRVPLGTESFHLIGHQGNERADHQGQGRFRQPGELVAEALSAAGRHHDEAVASLERCLYGLTLARAEAGVAHVFQEPVGGRLSGEDASRHRFGQFDALETLQCEGRFLLLVRDEDGLPRLLGRGSRTPSVVMGVARAAGNQRGDSAGQGSRRVAGFPVQRFPGLAQGIESHVDLRIPGSVLRFALEIADQPRGLKLELVGCEGGRSHRSRLETVPDEEISPLQGKSPAGRAGLLVLLREERDSMISICVFDQ